MKTRSRPFVKPFRMGDVVLVNGDKEEHIIHKVDFDGGSFEYATNRSAWHGHRHCTLVKKCDRASLSQLRKDIEEENESYYE